MKKSIVAIICLSALEVNAGQIVTTPIKQFATTNQQTSSWKRDCWETGKRWNVIDPKTGLKTGGFIERDRWEPNNRWNVYDQKGNYSGMIERDRFESVRWNYTPYGEIESYHDGIDEYDDGLGGLPNPE